VILASAVEDEFGVQVEPEEMERLNSFQTYLSWLAEGPRTAPSAARDQAARDQIVT
jgi:hypothetical protein